MIQTILIWLALGLVLGIVARAILPGEQKIGLLPTIIVGIVGALLGGFLGGYLGINMEEFSIFSVLAALAGAVVILIVWCLVTKKKWR